MTNDNPTVLLHIFMRPMAGRLWFRARDRFTITVPNVSHHHRHEHTIAGNGRSPTD
jgi:hypothetical protein